MLYVIIFTAPAETLEDTLLFFHNDAREWGVERGGKPFANCKLQSTNPPSSTPRHTLVKQKEKDIHHKGTKTIEPTTPLTVCGVPAGLLARDLSFTTCYVIDDTMQLVELAVPQKPDLVHFLHLGRPGEVARHQELSARFAGAGIPMANPYNQGTANCDGKFRMYTLLQEAGIPTPETVLVSRFNRNKRTHLQEAAVQWEECYIQPDQGTEGMDTYYYSAGKTRLGVDRLDDILRQLENRECDFVIRKKAGNLVHNKKNTVLRINVTFDGHTFRAESGYAMIGAAVVSAGQGAVREDLNRVLAPYPAAVESVKRTAAGAVEALFKGNQPASVCGVDVVLEIQERVIPYVIDVNPRPVVVGSRLIGSDRLFLGQHYWQGVANAYGKVH